MKAGFLRFSDKLTSASDGWDRASLEKQLLELRKRNPGAVKFFMDWQQTDLEPCIRKECPVGYHQNCTAPRLLLNVEYSGGGFDLDLR